MTGFVSIIQNSTNTRWNGSLCFKRAGFMSKRYHPTLVLSFPERYKCREPHALETPEPAAQRALFPLAKSYSASPNLVQHFWGHCLHRILLCDLVNLNPNLSAVAETLKEHMLSKQAVYPAREVLYTLADSASLMSLAPSASTLISCLKATASLG